MTANETKIRLAQNFGMDVIENLALDTFPKHLSDKIPYVFVRKNLILPILDTEKNLVVATADPLNVGALDELRFMLDKEIKAVYASEEKILAAINVCYH